MIGPLAEPTAWIANSTSDRRAAHVRRRRVEQPRLQHGADREQEEAEDAR